MSENQVVKDEPFYEERPRAKPANADFIDLQRRLNEDPFFAQFRATFIEPRIQQARAGLLKPCAGIEDVLNQERLKAAAIALEGLLLVLDTRVPDTRKEKGDADDASE